MTISLKKFAFSNNVYKHINFLFILFEYPKIIFLFLLFLFICIYYCILKHYTRVD